MKERNATTTRRTGKTGVEKKGKKRETIWGLHPDIDVPPDSNRRAKGQCRLVLSINRHLDLVALTAGLRLPQAVLTKQTSPLWLDPKPHTYTLISCVLVWIPGLTKVTSGVDWILFKWASVRLSSFSETSSPQTSRPWTAHTPFPERLMHLAHKDGNISRRQKSESDWLTSTGFPGA